MVVSTAELGFFSEVQFCNNEYIEAIHEGAKYTAVMDNFLKEGKDYKGLKSAMEKVIKANELSDEELMKSPSKIITVCKRAAQIILDLAGLGVQLVEFFGNLFMAFFPGGVNLGFIKIKVIRFSIIKWLLWMLAFYVVKTLIRLLRLAVDTAEFNHCKKEAEHIYMLLKDRAESEKDPEIKEKYLEEAKKLKKKIQYYSR